MAAPLSSVSSATVQFELSVRVPPNRGAYVRLELLDMGRKIKELVSDTFNQSTKFIVTIPAETKAIKASLGALEGGFWTAPFAGTQKALELKVKGPGWETVYSHDFAVATFETRQLG